MYWNYIYVSLWLVETIIGLVYTHLFCLTVTVANYVNQITLASVPASNQY